MLEVPKFQKGQSGNPKGRTPGSGLRQLLVPHAPALIAKAVELALGGNETALRICIDRILPTLKSEMLPVTLEGIDGTLAEQGAGIVRAMAKGEITPDETATLLQALASQARIIEVDELQKRLTALEERVKPDDKVS